MSYAKAMRDRLHLSDRFVQHLAAEIVGRVYAAGDALDAETKLAADYELSKPTVRQGLAKLADVGLIRIQHGKRSIVLGESEWNVLDPVVHQAFRDAHRGFELGRHLWEVRRLLESAAAARAAEQATDDELDQLDRLVGRMWEIARSDRDVRRFLEVDYAFYSLMAEASRNPALSCVIRPVHGFLSTLWSSESRIRAELLPTLAEEHDRIVAAIRARDPERARTEIVAHLARAEHLGQAVECPTSMPVPASAPDGP